MSVRVQLAVAAALSLVGVVVLAMPAGLEGPRLFEFSPGHGPSVLDMFGMVPLIVGGTWLNIAVVRQLPNLRLGPRRYFGLGVLAGAGLGAIIASVYSEFAGWWMVGAILVGTTMLGSALGAFLRRAPAV